MKRMQPLFEIDLWDAIASLSPARSRALCLRYGIGCQPHTLKAGAQVMGIHTETFRGKVVRARCDILQFLRLRKYRLV